MQFKLWNLVILGKPATFGFCTRVFTPKATVLKFKQWLDMNPLPTHGRGNATMA
jgi:hypothetical protein